MVYDGVSTQAMRIFVNGVEVTGNLPTAGTFSALTNRPGHFIGLGRRYSTTSPAANAALNGRICLAAIYDKVLDPTRIKAHYDEGIK